MATANAGWASLSKLTSTCSPGRTRPTPSALPRRENSIPQLSGACDLLVITNESLTRSNHVPARPTYEKAYGSHNSRSCHGTSSDQRVRRRPTARPASARPTKAMVSGSGTPLGVHPGAVGFSVQKSTAVFCTPTVKPFQNSFELLRQVTVSNVPRNRSAP